jgi:hypothetical protein
MPKKNSNKDYFTLDVDNAIIRYNLSENIKERNFIYSKEIYPSLDKLAENLINTYKCPYIDLEFDDLKNDLVSFITEKLPNFSQSAGKAYSYYTVAGRNYLIALNTKNYRNRKQIKQIVDLDDVDEERDVISEVYRDDYREDLNIFVDRWVDDMYLKIYNIFKNEDEIAIADSVLELFKIRNMIDAFNKKAIYFIVRERTGIKTQKITKVINVLKRYFNNSMNEYFKK